MTDDSSTADGSRTSALAIAIGIVAIGCFVLWQGWTIGTEQSAYARVGPQVFPYVIGTGLVVIGILLTLDALRRNWTVTWVDLDDDEVRPQRRALLKQFGNVVLIAVGLIVNFCLLGQFGFVVASTAMFALATRAFGSRRPVFDLAVGALFSGAIFLIFVYALGLPLPGGSVWGGR